MTNDIHDDELEAIVKEGLDRETDAREDLESPYTSDEGEQRDERIVKVKISDITIGRRLRKKETDIQTLANSIIQNGLLHPIILDDDFNLIAGFRRIKAYEDLGRTEIPARILSINNPSQAEYDENMQRAPFSLEDIAAINERVKESRIGHRPRSSSDENNEKKKVGNLPTLFSFPKGPSDVITGKIVGHSEKSVNKIIAMVHAAKDHPDLQKYIEAVDKGMSLARGHALITQALNREKPKLAPPQGEYEILYVDPPWTYGYSGQGSPQDHYLVQSLEEIKNLALPAARNAVLFLWVPYPMNKEAFEVIASWGFEYKSKIIWIKSNRFGIGHYVRAKHEELFICVKGKGFGVPAVQDRPESVISTEHTTHSKKPEIFYSIVEKMYPGRTRIEMFARGKPRDGWTAWGLEAESSLSLDENN